MRKSIFLTLCAGMAVTGCGEAQQASQALAEQQSEPMTEDEMRLAKNQCEIQAVMQGGTSEQATALCDCTIETLAEGRSASELEVLDAETANAALNQCAGELGIG